LRPLWKNKERRHKKLREMSSRLRLAPKKLRQTFSVSKTPRKIAIGKGELVREGKDAVIITLGSRVYPALEAAMDLEKDGVDVAVFNTRFIKPLPKKQLLELAADFKRILFVEENALAGGFGSAVLEMFVEEEVLDGHDVKLLGVPDEFIEHGTQTELRAMLGIDSDGMKKVLKEMLN